MVIAAEAASGRATPAIGEDTPEVVTQAKLDEAMQQLWGKVETELQTFRIALQSVIHGVDIDALAVAASLSSESRSVHHACPNSITFGCPKEVSSVNAQPIDIGSNPNVRACNFSDSSMHVSHLSPEHPDSTPNVLSSSTAKPSPTVTHMEVRDYILHQHGTYQWNNTLWDVCTFVGTSALGHAGSSLICILTAVAALVQLLYVVIIEDLLVPDTMSIKVVDGLRNWRVRTAHDVRFMDEASGISLAARVCNFDAGLEMSTTQQGFAQSIDHFLLGELFLNGPRVCLVAIASFLTLVLVELRQTTSWVLSLYQLVRRSGTFISLDREAVKKLKLVSISRSRFICILLLALIRIFIAVSLGYVSVRYLMYTTSVSQLFLMAMKFAFVLNVDELLFQSLSSHVVKVMISQVANISAPHRLRVHMGCDVPSTLCAIVLVSVLLLAKALVIDVVQERLKILQDAVCGGNKNFVFAINPTDGSIEWAVTDELQHNQESYRRSAILELQKAELSPDFTPKLSRKATVGRVIGLRSMTMGEKRADVFTTCVDRLELYKNTEPNAYSMAQAILSAKVGHEVTSCQDINPSFCEDYFAPEVRAHCPVWCGCGDWTSGLFVNGRTFGCNEACFTDFRVSTHMHETKCVDMTTEQLHKSSAWIRYWNGFERHHQQLNIEYEVSQMGARVALEEQGCAIITISAGIGANFCERYLGGSPLTAFCPETCGCTDNRTRNRLSRYCPPSCKDTTSSQSSQFKYDCSSAPQPLSDAGFCNVTVLGQVLYTIESLEFQCCNMINDAASEFLDLGFVSDSMMGDLCCMEGCIDQVLQEALLEDLLTGVGLGKDACYT